MDRARFGEVEKIFQAVVDRPRPDRRLLADEMCGEDRTLRHEVESLLEAHEIAQQLADSVVLARRVEEAGDRFPEMTEEDRRFGPYSVIGELGAGGMGTVYLGARTDDEFDRRVAVKVLRSGLDEHLLARFRTERQILADLEHPNIARLYEGGTAANGVPYFVMEYVDGVAIDVYCDRHRLPVAERLRLFRQVLDAVSYAHRNLVVHRDIKPSNILVTAEGVPKLLDFGIAKWLAPPAGHATTRTAGLPLTPAYASPEQLRGAAITTATDVYALGVLLYELLTARLPYDPRVAERIAAILEDRPAPRPSLVAVRDEEVLLADGATRERRTQPEVCSARRCDPRQLRRALAGDLDAIVRKALRHDPGERYATVDRLAEDLDRQAGGHPVRARRGTLGYRVSRFASRHRIGVSLTASALALVIATAVVLALMATRIAAERDKAEHVTEFLIDFFEIADPGQTWGDTITVREALDRGAASLGDQLGGQPEVRAALQHAIARIYDNLGLYDKAAELFKEALDLRRQVLGSAHPDTLDSLTRLALAFDIGGDFETAKALYEEALDLGRGGDLAAAENLGNLARVLRFEGELEEAEKRLRQALAIVDSIGADESSKSKSRLLMELGQLLQIQGRFEAAEEIYRESLALARQVLSPDDPLLLTVLKSYAYLVMRRGDLTGAETLYLELLELERAIFGEEHPKIAYTLNHLGILKRRAGDLEAAEDWARRGLDMRLKLLGADNLAVGPSLSSLAAIQCERGRFHEAEESYRRSLEIARHHLPPQSPELPFLLVSFARCLMSEGRHEGAEPLLREALQIRRLTLVDDSELIREVERMLGRCLTNLGRPEETATLQRSGDTIAAVPPRSASE